jgi:outer membrane protein TolC
MVQREKRKTLHSVGNVLIVLLFFVADAAIKQVFAAEPAVAQPPAMRDQGPVRTLTLEQSIALAFTHNPGLQIERERISELENDYRIASSGLYPRISVSAYAMQLNSDRVGVLPGMTYTGETFAQLKARQLLYDGGKVRFGGRAAGIAADAQRESAEATRLDTVFAVSQAYYRVLEARELVRVAQDSLEQRDVFSKITGAFVKAGKATRLETLSAEAQLFDAQRSLLQAREAARLSELILKRTIGLDLETRIKIVDTFPDSVAESGDEASLLREAYEHSPDLKKTALVREQSLYSLRSAYGSYQPEISLQGTYGYRDRNTNSGADEWTAGVFLEWALFEGGLTRAQVGKARARVNEADWSEKAVRDQVQVDLQEALGNLNTARATITASKRQVEAQEEAYQAAVSFYERGKSTYFEVLSAQADLTQAKASYVLAVSDYLNASARLDRVVGRGNKHETGKR